MLKVIILILLCSTISASASEPALFQVIHNSADTSMGLVDIYLNGSKILGKMAFRTATPFVPVTSENAFQLAVTRSGSIDTLLTLNYRPEQGIATTFLLHGVTDTTKYHPNPDGKSIRLQWTIVENITTKSMPNDEVAVKIADGCTDIATSNLIARDVAPLLPSMGYGGSTPSTIIMPPTSYEFLLVEPNTWEIVRSFTVNLSALGGKPVVLFFSGFAHPQENAGGSALGLYAALLDGTLVNVSIPTTVHEFVQRDQISCFKSAGEWILESSEERGEAEVYSLIGEKIMSFPVEPGVKYHLPTQGHTNFVIITTSSRVIFTKVLLQ